MRVLIIGEAEPWSLATSYARGFGDLGVEVEQYCEKSALFSAFPLARSRGFRRLLRPVAIRRLNTHLRDRLRNRRVDLVLVTKGRDLLPTTIAELRRSIGAPIVNYYPDDPFSELDSNRPAGGPHLLAAYDVCFTFARHLIPRIEAVGAKRVEYLPFARDPYLHAPAKQPESPEFDLVFVGNLDRERIRWLEAVADYRLGIFGDPLLTRIPRGSPLRHAEILPAAYGPDLARALARGAISLNIMRLQNRLSHNMRSFEAPACAAFCLSQRTPELVELFRDGEEIIFFDSPRQLGEQAGKWLADSAGRDRVAHGGFRRVENDTYAVRAASLLSAVGLDQPIALPETA